MQSVGKFYNDNTNIVRHCKKHFAKIFHMSFFRRRDFDFVKFCNAVHERGDVVAEKTAYVVERVFGIFNNVVQKRGANRFNVKFQLCNCDCNVQRVHNIRITRNSFLIFVRLICKVERLVNRL